MSRRPHIIIFNPDEMRADALSHLGNPAAITPNFDTFAKGDAVSFRNAYCQNPVCVPSRCSFFTGLYPHVRGHRTMTHLLRPGEVSLLGELKDAGYTVWMNDRNDLCAAQYPGWMESQANEVFYGGNCKAAPGPIDPKRGAPGSKFYYAHYEGQLGLDENGKNYTGDDEAVDAAIERIGRWQEGDAPLCMFLGLNFPHPTYQVEEPYYSAIDRSKLPPRIDPKDCTGKNKMEQLIRGYQNLDALTDEDWDDIRAIYLGMTMKIDVLFGRLVQALKDAGIYDDCAIFVMSDHGDFTGDYGIVEKSQNCFEDCLSRVPFLIKPPKGDTVDAGISESLAELVDLYATVMDYAGVTPSHTHFGKSLRPVLRDRSASVREYAFCEGGRNPDETHCDEYHTAAGTAKENDAYWPKKKAQSDHEAHAKATMIRDGRYKYISRTLGQDELYDLAEDPREMHNRIDDPALASEQLRLQKALMKWLQVTADIVPYDYDQRFTEEMLWRKMRSFVPAQFEEDMRQKIRSGMAIGPLFGYAMSLMAKGKEQA